MPITVPRYQQQVQEQGAPDVKFGVETSREAFGGGESTQNAFQAVGGMAEVASKMFQEQKKNADQVAFMDADSRASALQLKLQLEAEGMKGRNAAGAIDVVSGSWKKGIEDIEKSLSNDDQKMAFRKSVSQRFEGLNKHVQTHSFKELEAYDDESTKNYIKNSRDEALTNYKDPQALGVSLYRQQSAIVEQGKRKGKDADTIREDLQKAMTETHAGVLERMVNNHEDLLAKEYFAKYKDEIDGDKVGDIEKLLKESSVKGESQRKSDYIFGKHQDDMESALKAARGIKDPEIRDATVDRVKDLFADKKRAKDQAIEDLHRGATDIIDQTGDWQKIPAAQWGKFSLSERASLKAYAKNRKEGVEPETKWDSYYNLKTMAASKETRDAFLKLNLYGDYRGQFADSEFKEMVKLQTDLREGKGNRDKELDGYLSDKDIVDGALKQFDFNPNPKPGNAEAEQVNRFRNMVDKEIRKRQEVTGKKISNEETREIVNNLMVDVVTKKRTFWFDEKKKAFEVDPTKDGLEDVESEQIPKSEKIKIEESLRRNGKPVTEAMVKSLYLRKLKGVTSGI